ncbi:MAG TPA: Maf family protein [Sedimentibacter sp.]|jgi:septum formation protein|nr:septum formation protein Maf [Sedimentibacter sp.]NLA13124.1 septum formation protein Maf [Tissierellia bacterium]HOA19638.1 Maf family protein [Sedimentibacter sp.]HOG62070.1 Maf family protein [Sedimentibacter sp.]HOT21061.1 Maf family protein [Sedimentibacter sp.]
MKKIVLASNSPRRIEMMKKYVDIITYIPDIVEKVNSFDYPQTTVMKVAFEKALNVYLKYKENALIIAADTIVYLDEIMGKPKDEAEAYKMLSLLSGKTHYVFTGICIIDTESSKKIVDYEKTQVVFNELTEGLIKRYLKTYEYLDKAGAYGIQGYGELLVKEIHGCYNNVKGLPIAKLNNLLSKHFSYDLL